MCVLVTPGHRDVGVVVTVGVAGCSLVSVSLDANRDHSRRDELGSVSGVMFDGQAAHFAGHLLVDWLADLSGHWDTLLHWGLHWHSVRN